MWTRKQKKPENAESENIQGGEQLAKVDVDLCDAAVIDHAEQAAPGNGPIYISSPDTYPY